MAIALKSLVIITRLNLNNKYDGHVIYFEDYLKDLVKEGIFNEILILTSVKIENKISKVRYIESLPPEIKNFKKYYSYLKQVSYICAKFSCVQFWFLPKYVFNPFILLNKGRKVYSFPDSWSAYFKNKFSVERRKIDLVRFAYYSFVESLLRYRGIQVFISEQEANKAGGIHFPHKLERLSVMDSKITNSVLVGRMSTKYFISLYEEVIASLPEIHFFVISSDIDIKKICLGASNVDTIDFVDDYEKLSSTFKIHLIYDAYTSGMSTKFINAVNVNRMAIGNENVFRGFESLNVPEQFCYNNWHDCKEKIVSAIGLNSENYSENLNSFYNGIIDNYGTGYRKKSYQQIYKY